MKIYIIFTSGRNLMNGDAAAHGMGKNKLAIDFINALMNFNPRKLNGE